tara:strand:+ start:234 stop:428 length:195 start_codon:yes stop_codon:yes gene_type:complete
MAVKAGSPEAAGEFAGKGDLAMTPEAADVVRLVLCVLFGPERIVNFRPLMQVHHKEKQDVCKIR